MYKSKINPFTGKLQKVADSTLLKIKGTVAATSNLPLSGNSENDCYIVTNVDRIYTWNKSTSTGLVTDWVDVGSTTSIAWAAVTDKPSSTVIAIDNAVSASHAHSNKSDIDTYDLTQTELIAELNEASIQFLIDNGDEAIATGLATGYIEVPFNCTIESCSLLAKQSGSIQIDIFKTSYANFDASVTHPVDADSITASAVPAISTATKFTDSTLTEWTKTLVKGEILAFYVDSCVTITSCTISLKLIKS